MGFRIDVQTPNREVLLAALGLPPELLGAFQAFVAQNGLSLLTGPQLRLKEAVVKYQASYLRRRSASESVSLTEKTYMQVLNVFVGHMAQRFQGLSEASQTVDRIAHADLEAFLFRTKTNGERRQPASIQRDIGILSSFLKWLRRHQHLRVNPLEGIDRPRPTNRLPVALSEAEQEGLLHLSRQSKNGLRNHTIIHLALNTGLRAAEIAGLTWSNADLEGSWLRFIGKGGKERTVPLRPCVVDSLRYYRKSCWEAQVAVPGFKDHMFLNTTGASWGSAMTVDGLEKMIKPQLEKLGRLKGAMHVLRHSFAVNLLRRGVHIVVISHLLGHALIETSRGYLRFGDADLARELAEFFPEGVVVPHTQVSLHDNDMKDLINEVFERPIL